MTTTEAVAATKDKEQFQKGFEVIIGPRKVLNAYHGRPWPEVVAAAEAGADLLRLTDERSLHITDEQSLQGVRGAHPYGWMYDVQADQFALRKIVAHIFGGPVAGLWLQCW